ncbi:MAG: methyltransferase domain-containing protein [Candidatus Zambryskibacteria bacterium]|nr:methyltransferase domain-containing protein [Candidatus Zambryskibacteria bacterium]
MFSDPVKNVEQCGIQAGMEIADFGSGSGHYSLAAARALISTGRVYAIDIQQELLTKLKNTATREGIYNIEVIWGDIEKINGTKLKDNTIDLVFLSNILFQIDDKEGVVKEVVRVLRSGGRVLVIDWMDSFGGLGPKPEVVFKKDVAMKMFEKYSFHLDREILAGEHHYGLIYKKL